MCSHVLIIKFDDECRCVEAWLRTTCRACRHRTVTTRSRSSAACTTDAGTHTSESSSAACTTDADTHTSENRIARCTTDADTHTSENRIARCTTDAWRTWRMCRRRARNGAACRSTTPLPSALPTSVRSRAGTE